MKKITKFLTLAVVMLAFTAATFGQVSATAVTSATIVSALTITNADPLDFGNIVTGTAGTVTMGPDGTRTSTGPVLNDTNVGTAATFDVAGTAELTYSIAISPASLLITHTTLPINTMTVDNFQSNPAEGDTGELDLAGEQTISVGGDLTVDAAQVPGTYQNAADLTVTINYN
jgi:hypothetical protein